MKKKFTQFEKWFRAQFGKLPHECRPYRDIVEDLSNAEKLVATLKAERDEHLDLQGKYQAASYARNASTIGFKF